MRTSKRSSHRRDRGGRHAGTCRMRHRRRAGTARSTRPNCPAGHRRSPRCGDVDALDPLIAYSAESRQVIRATTRQLVTYPGNKEEHRRGHRGGARPRRELGYQPGPEDVHLPLYGTVSTSPVPAPRPITAQDFVYAVKRFPDPNAQVSAITYYNALFDGFTQYAEEFAKVPTGDLEAVQQLHRYPRDPRPEGAWTTETLQLTLDPAGKRYPGHSDAELRHPAA